MRFQNGVRSALLVLPFVVTLAACGETTTTIEEPTDVSPNTGTCFGSVVDWQTRAGIADAVVEIFAGAIPSTAANASDSAGEETNFVARTTTAADDTDTTLFSEAGMWRISNLPTGGTYIIRISATDYATSQITCGLVTDSFDNTPVSVDTNTVLMARAVTATVHLVDAETGSAVTGCSVFAVPEVGAFTEDGGGDTSDITVLANGIEVSAVADANGDAALTGLSPLLDYAIVVPACDTNGDNAYDFQSAAVALDERIDTASTRTVAMRAAEVDDTPAIIASSCLQFSLVEDAANASCAVPASGSVTYVFNFPILDLDTDQLQLTLNSEATFTTSTLGGAIWGRGAALDFDGDDQTATDTAVDTAFTAALSAGNTVLTVTPSAALTVNGLYTLDGDITFTESGVVTDVDVEFVDFAATLAASGLFNDELIYVIPDSDATIADPTADNYNGSDDDDPAAAAAVCLEFSEVVSGTVEVLSTVADADVGVTDPVTTVLQNPAAVNLNTGSLINEGQNGDGVCGGGAGCPDSTDGTCTGGADETEAIKYAVPLGVALRDNVTNMTNSVTVFVDAIDYAGNRLREVYTLAIQ